MSTPDELLALVDESGQIIGSVRRSVAHSDPTKIHPVVHCLVVNPRGDLLLQLRGRHKDVQPGRWDTSVGGHVGVGEAIEAAIRREIQEELGLIVDGSQLVQLYRYVMRSAIETELVTTFRLVHNGPFFPEPVEIEALQFWSHERISTQLGRGTFTPNFEDEFDRYLDWLSHVGRVATELASLPARRSRL